jgi:hypothetical protein
MAALVYLNGIDSLHGVLRLGVCVTSAHTLTREARADSLDTGDGGVYGDFSGMVNEEQMLIEHHLAV